MLNFEAALRRAWPILIEAARQERTVSYSELAGRAGPPLHHRGLHRVLLRELSARCARAGLPDLPALVVRKDARVPGQGWFRPSPLHDDDPLRRWMDSVEACWKHSWTDSVDPRLLAPASPRADLPDRDQHASEIVHEIQRTHDRRTS